jgi:hypothetical protein
MLNFTPLSQLAFDFLVLFNWFCFTALNHEAPNLFNKFIFNDSKPLEGNPFLKTGTLLSHGDTLKLDVGSECINGLLFRI